MELEVFEILQKFTEQSTRTDKIKLLKANGIPAVKDVCRGAFDSSIEWNLPTGKPPYTPNKPESTPSTLRMAHRDFGFYVKGFKKYQTVSLRGDARTCLFNYLRAFIQTMR